MTAAFLGCGHRALLEKLRRPCPFRGALGGRNEAWGREGQGRESLGGKLVAPRSGPSLIWVFCPTGHPGLPHTPCLGCPTAPQPSPGWHASWKSSFPVRLSPAFRNTPESLPHHPPSAPKATSLIPSIQQHLPGVWSSTCEKVLVRVKSEVTAAGPGLGRRLALVLFCLGAQAGENCPFSAQVRAAEAISRCILQAWAPTGWTEKTGAVISVKGEAVAIKACPTVSRQRLSSSRGLPQAQNPLAQLHARGWWEPSAASAGGPCGAGLWQVE